MHQGNRIDVCQERGVFYVPTYIIGNQDADTAKKTVI